MLVKLSLCQVTPARLPKLKMVPFQSPAFPTTVDMTDDSKFLLVRTKLTDKQCQFILYYEFAEEGLVSVENADEDKRVFSTLKYVAPGTPLPLMTRRIESTLLKEKVFFNLCREGTWKERRGMAQILRVWNIIDWDQGYLERWTDKTTKTTFLKLPEPQKVDLEKLNLNMINGDIVHRESSALQFDLPVIDKEELTKKIVTTIKISLNNCFKLMYKLNSLADERVEILREVPKEKTWFEKLLPYISNFFGLGAYEEKETSVKRINLMTLKVDMDHILGFMENELMTRDDLYQKSERILKMHNREFLPMLENKLFILSQMEWKMRDIDPYHQFNHLMRDQIAELLKFLDDPDMTEKRFKFHFAEVFIIYYTQIVNDFDMLGTKSPYMEFINEYLTDIFTRMKNEMNGLMGLITQDKAHLMNKVQGELLKTYQYLKSNEPVLLPVYPELIESAENIGAQFYNHYVSAGVLEKTKMKSSFKFLQLMESNGRAVKRVRFEPFELAPLKTNELL